jgi:uncharacterized membrane protein YciS (DUF1049 family)
MNEERRQWSQLMASWIQTGMLACTIIAALLYVGRRDQQLEATTIQVKELSSIVTDLAKTQVSLSIRSEQSESRLLDIIARIERLERNKL